jgi:hypothetical protein
MNLTLAEMFKNLGRDVASEEDKYGINVGHDFMRSFPGYPVLRVRIRPREAYIAPTDNLIHDGSSVGKNYPDIAVHLLGYFGVAPEVATAAYA